uniref:Putative portal protein n=1 Tax=viral metagenome TaxID=1070528 RepID=A0A6M3KUN3_9ZZZZ
MVEENTNQITEQKKENPEQALLEKLDSWFNESLEWMRNIRQRWLKNERWFKNEIDDSQFPGGKKNTKLKINLTLADIMNELSIIDDYCPDFDIMPEEADDQEFADQLQNRKNQVCNKINFKSKILESCKDYLLYSHGIVYVAPEFNNVITAIDEEGLDEGDEDYEASEDSKTVMKRVYNNKIVMESIDPFICFPQPGCTGIDIHKGESTYVIFAEPKFISEIKRKYHKEIGDREIKPEGMLKDGKWTWVERDSKVSSEVPLANYVLLKRCYFMDENYAKYPKGRFVKWVNDIIVEDISYNFNHIPFFLMINNRIPHSFKGMGEPELTKDIMLTINRTLSAMADNIEKTGNPIRKILKTLWSTLKGKINNAPGDDVQVNSMEDIQYLDAPSMPAYVFNFLNLLIMFHDTVIGIQDVTQGKKPTGITAARAIEILQEAAQSRIRFKISHDITDFIVSIGRFIVELLQIYDSEILNIRTVDEKGQVSFAEYNPTLQNKKGTTQRDSTMEIEVVRGTTMPTGRLASQERAREMFEKGEVGIEYLAREMAVKDRKFFIQSYYDRMNLMQEKMRSNMLEKEMPKFQTQIASLLNELKNKGKHSGVTEQIIADAIKKFPELVTSEEFSYLPEKVQRRILSVFIIKQQPKLTDITEENEAETVAQ